MCFNPNVISVNATTCVFLQNNLINTGVCIIQSSLENKRKPRMQCKLPRVSLDEYG